MLKLALVAMLLLPGVFFLGGARGYERGKTDVANSMAIQRVIIFSPEAKCLVIADPHDLPKIGYKASLAVLLEPVSAH